jgi:hypothetical protein
MLQRNTSVSVASLDEGAASGPKAVIRTANALKHCAFRAIPSLLFRYPHDRSRGIGPSELQCCTAK